MKIEDSYKELVSHFDQYLIGQEELSRNILVNLKLREVYLAAKGNRITPPLNLLVKGKSGSGKTHSISLICKSLGIPFVSVNVPDYTAAGYIGGSLPEILSSLIGKSSEILAKQQKEAYKREEAEAQAAVKTQKAIESPGEIFIRETKGLNPGSPEYTDAVKRYSDSILKSLDFSSKAIIKSPKKKRRPLFRYEDETDSDIPKAKAIKFAELKGVILLDEFDKLFFKTHTYNVGTDGIKRELLGYLSGANVKCEEGFIDTSNILFICAGAFDMVEFKSMPVEILGRLPTRLTTQKATADVFTRMISSPVLDMFKELRQVLEYKKINEFIVTPEMAEYIGKELERYENGISIGVRRLTTFIVEITKFFFVTDDYENMKSLTLEKDTVDFILERIDKGLRDDQ